MIKILDRIISFIHVMLQGIILITLAPSMLIYYTSPFMGDRYVQEITIRLLTGGCLWGIFFTLYNLAGLV